MASKNPEQENSKAAGKQETGKQEGEKVSGPQTAAGKGTGKPAAKEGEIPAPESAKLAELTDSLKRVQAEFENYKKRVEREKAEIVKIASMDLLAELLTILDDFERAPIAEIKDEKVRKGIEMISGNFRKILEDEGVKPVPAEGLLDPHRHEALMWVEQEDLPDNTIVSVLQKGYSLNGRILRPARVSVSKKPETAHDKKEDVENKKMEGSE